MCVEAEPDIQIPNIEGDLTCLNQNQVDKIIAQCITLQDIDGLIAWAERCEAFRYFDFAFEIRQAAFNQAYSPYHASYAFLSLLNQGVGLDVLATTAKKLISELEAGTFQQESDDFHIGMAKKAIEDTIVVKLIEDEVRDPWQFEKGGLHGIAIEAIWKRAWVAHVSLASPRARRLAIAYLRLTGWDHDLVLYTVETFFAFHGGGETALAMLETIKSDEPTVEIRCLVLKLAIYFEDCQLDAFDNEWAIFEACLGRISPRPDELRAAVASTQLLRVRWLHDNGQIVPAQEYLQQLKLDYAALSEIGAIHEAFADLLAHTDTSAALHALETAINAPHNLRTTFKIAGPDIAAFAGRWDLVQEQFEGFACNIRSHYGAVFENQPHYDEATPAQLPKKALILSGWGLGDDAYRLGLLALMKPHSDLTMMLDPRLLEMAQRAFPEWGFLAHSRGAEVGWEQFWKDRRGVSVALDPLRCTYDAVMEARRLGAVTVSEDYPAYFAALKQEKPDRSDLLPVKQCLQPRADRILEAQNWVKSISNGKPVVGICWRSGLSTGLRNRSFFSTAEVAELIAGVDVNWVLLQYGWTKQEKSTIELESGRTLHVFEQLDLTNDIEGMAALGLACDLVLSTGVSTREVCAAAGANVYSISFGWPQANAWRRDAAGKDLIFDSLVHADPTFGARSVLIQAIRYCNTSLFPVDFMAGT
jgi:hypothetical protein